MTSLGNIHLTRDDGALAAVQVTRKKGEFFDAVYSITDLNSKKNLGELVVAWKETAAQIEGLTNFTHERDEPKVHMGRVYHECIVAEFLKSKKKEIVVYSTGSQWYYLSIGFEPFSDTRFPKHYKFPKAFIIYSFWQRKVPLYGEYQETFEIHRKFLAEIRGVKEEELTVEEVCVSQDFAKEIVTIAKRARQLKKNIPMMTYPNMNMRMNSEGLERGKMRILSSSLHHDQNLVAELQDELLVDYGKQQPPKKVVDLIVQYAAPAPLS